MKRNMSVELLKSASKEYAELPRLEQRRIARLLDGLERDPLPGGAKKLQGYSGYRLRSGQYRILYQIDSETSRVLIVRIGLRNHVYRHLERILGI